MVGSLAPRYAELSGIVDVVPCPSAHNAACAPVDGPVGSVARTCRIPFVPVVAPFRNVSAHIIQSPRIRQFLRVPWYKAEPKPGVYDWTWIDKPVEYLVDQLKIVPIMDLIDYGTPTWMADGVTDARFPEAIARYARAMARHFKGLVNHYTPPQPEVTCLWCGLSSGGRPSPGQPGSLVAIGVAVAKGMALGTQAIRAAIPDAVILSAECFTGAEGSNAISVWRKRSAPEGFRVGRRVFARLTGLRQNHGGHPLGDFRRAWREEIRTGVVCPEYRQAGLLGVQLLPGHRGQRWNQLETGRSQRGWGLGKGRAPGTERSLTCRFTSRKPVPGSGRGARRLY